MAHACFTLQYGGPIVLWVFLRAEPSCGAMLFYDTEDWWQARAALGPRAHWGCYSWPLRCLSAFVPEIMA